MGLDPVIAIGRRADQGHQRRRMFQDAGGELARLGREPVLVGRIEEGVLARLAVDQADMEMAAASPPWSPRAST